MKRKRIFWWLIPISLLATFLLSGCQYNLQSPLPSPTSKIAIPIFVNKTFHEGLEEILTQEVINNFLLKTRFRVVKEEKADIVLKGKILYYLNEPLSEITAGEKEYKVRIETLVTLVSREKGNVFWREKISEATIYSIFGPIQTEEEATKQTCGKIAEDLVNLALKGWKK
ncbi:hypothetical protein J7M02_06950 [Candidatus Aerophobetes bacterium]|nr:hypothetical protein [Candidatus Aerophobetes bacterium]